MLRQYQNLAILVYFSIFQVVPNPAAENSFIAIAFLRIYELTEDQWEYLVMDLFAEIESIPKILSGVIETSQAQKKVMSSKSQEKCISLYYFPRFNFIISSLLWNA